MSTLSALNERIISAASRMGVTVNKIQQALDCPGFEMEDRMVAIILEYAEITSGVYTPLGAEKTGLVPMGCRIQTDSPEGSLDSARFDFSSRPVLEGERCVTGRAALHAAVSSPQVVGSLGLAAKLLMAQRHGKEIFPKESQGCYFLLPRTVLIDPGTYECFPVFEYKRVSELWAVNFFLVDDLIGSDARFIRLA